MKSLAEVNSLLSKFESQFGLQVLGAQQGSAAWMNLKLGVLSASNASKIVAGKTTEGRLTYMSELVGQVATGIFEEISSKHLDWGNAHEDGARAGYEFQTGHVITQVPFVFLDDSFRVGCSPDGFIEALSRGAEIKCPSNTANYIKFLTEEKLKSEWDWQTQFSMHVTKAETWDVVQFDPRMHSKPLHFITVERDEKKMTTFADAIPQFISDMDKMLEKVGIKFGEQWSRLATEKEQAG